MSKYLNKTCTYHGEYDNCHGVMYKVVESYDDRWFDIKTTTARSILTGIYNEILSVPIEELNFET
jgi:hypothetical protein